MTDQGGSQSFGEVRAGRDIHINQFLRGRWSEDADDDDVRSTRAPETRSGRVEPSEIDAVRAHYCRRPIDDDLVARLRAHRLVLLYGHPGWGRRAASLEALAALTAYRINVVDVPTLGMLSPVPFVRDESYLFDASAIPPNVEEWSEAWVHVLHARVTTSGAYLVVLLPRGRFGPDLPHILRWARIENAALLDAAGLNPGPEDGEAMIANLVGEEASVSEVSRLLAHLRRCQDTGILLEEAIGTHSGSKRAEIRENVLAIRDRDAAAMVASLCFLGGTSETTLDTGHLDLMAALSCDDDDDERKQSRSDRFASRGDLVDRCFGRQTTTRRDVGSIQLDVPVIDFKVPAHASIYLHEFWTSRSNSLRRDLVLWIRRFIPRLHADDFVVAAARVALLADTDLNLLVTEILHHWSGGEPNEAFLAAGVLQFVAANGRTPQATQVATMWAKEPSSSPRLLAATYFLGMVADEHPETALLVFERKCLWDSRRPEYDAALEGWALLAGAAAEDRIIAERVARHLAARPDLDKPQPDRPIFILLDEWFDGGPTRVPLALRTAALSPSAESDVAAVLFRTSARSHHHLGWFRSLVGYLDSGRQDLETVAERLIERSIASLSQPRRSYVVEVLKHRIRVWNCGSNRTSGAATERAHRILDTCLQRRDQ